MPGIVVGTVVPVGTITGGQCTGHVW
jgi:hypothetical protein